MRFDLRAAGTALLAGTMLALAAAPAGAATGPSLTRAVRDVHAADSSLTQLRQLASSDAARAGGALARGREDVAAAAHQARWLHARASSGVAAAAFEDVASQYERDLQTYTSLLKTSSGALRTALAEALVPALAGRTQALGFLGEMTGRLSLRDALMATSTMTGVISDTPTELSSLTGLASTSGLPAQIQQLIAQAIATAGGVFDAGVSELGGLIPSLPAPAQPVVQSILTQLTGAIHQVETMLEGSSAGIGGMLGGVIGTELGQVTSVLNTILGDLGDLSTAGTGAGGTSGGGTGAILGDLGGLFPPFLTTLLGQLGIAVPGL